MEKRILIAIDDSENAMRGVEFVSKSFTTDHRITLFSVVLDTPAICDLNSPGLTPYFLSQKAAFCELEDQKKDLMTKAMREAREVLLKAGFEEKNIAVKIEDKKKGVARGIIDEGDSGYDLIVLGRRGLSGIKEFFLGSISQKVLQSAKGVSILVVD
ncbi:MAG: universal stress protein [Desulfobacterales bacterium]|nr:universal stress protein [Desulfobacterales bacterium]